MNQWMPLAVMLVACITLVAIEFSSVFDFSTDRSCLTCSTARTDSRLLYQKQQADPLDQKIRERQRDKVLPEKVEIQLDKDGRGKFLPRAGKNSIEKEQQGKSLPGAGKVTHEKERAARMKVPVVKTSSPGLYHNWDVFLRDYRSMLRSFKIYVYPDVFNTSSEFSKVFLPHKNPYDRRLGNYFSEHMFKINLLNSSFVTDNPAEAHLFFMPFSVNVMRNEPRIYAETAIASFVERYVGKISSEYKFWNRTAGGDHFYVACHSAGRNAAVNSRDLRQNAIQVTCCANYFQKLYAPHKDVSLPQVWPRASRIPSVPPEKKTRLAFFSGRAQNSRVRQILLRLWSNDTDMDVYAGSIPGSYEQAFSRSKFCLHVKGYEVNTARISDAIHFGCVPVIISNYYDLPLSNVINWKSFSVIVSHAEIPLLKSILQKIKPEEYARLRGNVLQVKKHFRWHLSPKEYDSFHMTMYQLWLRRHLIRAHL